MSGSTPGRIVIAGASGVVGRHIITLAKEKGYTVQTLTRGSSGTDPAGFERCTWQAPEAAAGDQSAITAIAKVIDGADIVVNLAGAGVADRRLTESWKREVLQSRLDVTRALINAWRACQAPPPFWVQASAVGYYGDTGDAEIDETQAEGDDFLAGVCVKWEAAANEIHTGADEKGVPRMVIARIGLVFGHDAKPWMEMTKPIRMGFGGPLGSGKQFYPWIDADDLARALFFLHDTPDASGPYNFTGPEPIRQIDLVKHIAKRLKRPSFLPAPRFALKIVLGEMADAILVSQRALPRRLLDAGFVFERPTIESELDFLLG